MFKSDESLYLKWIRTLISSKKKVSLTSLKGVVTALGHTKRFWSAKIWLQSGASRRAQAGSRRTRVPQAPSHAPAVAGRSRQDGGGPRVTGRAPHRADVSVRAPQGRCRVASPAPLQPPLGGSRPAPPPRLSAFAPKRPVTPPCVAAPPPSVFSNRGGGRDWLACAPRD